MNGCNKYIQATVTIYFAGDTVCCARCPLLETYARNQCRRTGEYILDTRVTGVWCPLRIEEDNNEIIPTSETL